MSINFSGERLILGLSPRRIEEVHVERYKFSSQFIKGKTVLDIACGTGYGSKILVDAGAAQVDGVDIAPDAVEYAQAHYSQPHVCFFLGDITDYRPSKSYDVIVCFETIEHTPGYKSALKNLNIALKPGGMLIISSPNRLITSPRAKTLNDKPTNKFHTQEFTIEELSVELRSHGFIVEPSSVYGQRQQLHFSNKYVNKLYNALLKPNFRATPVVMPVGKLFPRTMVILATKPTS